MTIQTTSTMLVEETMQENREEERVTAVKKIHRDNHDTAVDREIALLRARTASAVGMARLRRSMLLADATDQQQSRHEGEQEQHQPQDASLPAWITRLLSEAVSSFLAKLGRGAEATTTTTGISLLTDWLEYQRVQQLLDIHYQCCTLDKTLGEELARQGTHLSLRRIITCPPPPTAMTIRNNDDDDECPNQDAVMELQDAACAIAAQYAGAFPRPAAPFTLEELQQRLPLVFDISPAGPTDNAKEIQSSQSVLIHQVTKRQTEQKDVGFVMWPSAVVLSRWIATHPSLLSSSGRNMTHREKDKDPSSIRILELGAGCGLVGLFVAKLLQQQQQQVPAETSQDSTPSVILTDFNEAVLENLEHNMALNNVTGICQTAGLDFYQQQSKVMTEEENVDSNTPARVAGSGWTDMSGKVQPPCDIILGADIICQPSDAIAAAHTVYRALTKNKNNNNNSDSNPNNDESCNASGVAYIVCATSKHRFGVDVFPEECRRLGLCVQVENVADLHDGAFLQSSKSSSSARLLDLTTGYVKGMELTMFTVKHNSDDCR